MYTPRLSPEFTNPAEWHVVAYFYFGKSDEQREAYAADNREFDEATDHRFESPSNIPPCALCGKPYGSYYHGVLVESDDGDRAFLGHVCARRAGFAVDTVTGLNVAQIRRANRQAKIVQAEAFLDGLEVDLRQDLEVDHHIIADVRVKLYRYGVISDRQVGLVRKIASEVRERDQAEAELVWTKALSGRHEFTARILATRVVETDWGTSTKALLLVETDDGVFKAWGAAPPSWVLDSPSVGRSASPWRGCRVAGRATFKPADDDPNFAWYSRPTWNELSVGPQEGEPS